MLSDLRYAIRQLWKSPGFALTAIFTLALGIGANTAIFTLVESIMLRPLPFPQQDKLMRIGYDGSQSETAFFPKGWLRALNQHSNAFAAVSGFGPNAEFNVGDTASTNRVFGAEVMANGFETLQIHPEVGRFFSDEDAIAGHDPVVVLSYGYWRNQFGANPGIVGHTMQVDGVSRRIEGVMPPGVRFPYADTQFLIPVTFKGGDIADPWQEFDLRAFGRLKPGVNPEQAQSELRRLQRALLPLFPWRMPDSWASEVTVIPLLDAQVGSVRPRLLLLFAAVGLILIIACANVANLMFARAAGREREIAIRGAMGASASRLVRQLLCESIVLGGLAGAMGVAAAAVSLRALVSLLPADTPRLGDVALHWPVLLFAAAISLLTGFLFGLLPALQMASPDLRGSLLSGNRSVAGRKGQFRTSMLLVVGQIALSVVVLTIAGLMLHSLWSISRVNPGFRTQRVVSAEVSLNATACQTKGHCNAFFETLLQHLGGVWGDGDVALADSLPLTARAGNYVYDAENHPRDPRQGALLATGRVVSPGYFSTLGITLLRGRLLQDQDKSGTTRAVVINEHMAQRLWPNEDPIGKKLLDVADEPTPAVWVPNAAMTVVGVVNNTHEGGLASGYGDEVYLPLTPRNEQPVLYVLVRSGGGTQETVARLRNSVAELDPAVPVTRVRTLNDIVASSQSTSRAVTLLLLAFGALALAIGSVGVYSLIAYVVSWRTREIGIRLALGAQRWQIVTSVVRQSLALSLAGCLAGMLTAAEVAQLLRGFLLDIRPVDPLTFCTVPLVMLCVAVLAAWVPARRAASVDPIKTLRLE